MVHPRVEGCGCRIMRRLSTGASCQEAERDGSWCLPFSPLSNYSTGNPRHGIAEPALRVDLLSSARPFWMHPCTHAEVWLLGHSKPVQLTVETACRRCSQSESFCFWWCSWYLEASGHTCTAFAHGCHMG